MGYYIRVLGTVATLPPLEAIRKAAQPAEIELDADHESGWEQFILKHPSGEPIALIERNLTHEGLGKDELAEFTEEVSHYKPSSASQWLESYFSKNSGNLCISATARNRRPRWMGTPTCTPSAHLASRKGNSPSRPGRVLK